jgi:hypothetical protein
MAEELVQRFAERGIDLPELMRLPAAGAAAVWAFGASGEAAVDWWRMPSRRTWSSGRKSLTT